MFEYCRLYVGQHQPLSKLLQDLVQLGYERVEAVASPGEVALHGGVLDVFPATFESPLRVELSGNQVISLRTFNPRTMETLDRHSMAVILPRQVRLRVSVEVPFESFVDLEPGDYVVHLAHGIGRYRGRTAIAGPNGAQNALAIEYAGGDLLYVPLDQLHLVQKYQAFGARHPALHTLGATRWDREKANAYIGAWMYAKTLLELQARRLALPGHACSKDHDWQQVFEAAFPYRETKDQRTATAEVKRDMEASRPMDRLLLGDVGYGKTEVAIRAAFKAVVDHRQVAVLVPTTILAYQHYRTFTKRMGAFPIQVEMLTRFQSEADQRRTLASLRSGGCDLVIGTHRLFSGDVRFKELGLLIVDEEQRFGVKDKERLKHWRSQVDVLTLSATPIPRTLYLALVGTREMSLIATAPENRHPVETHVVEEDAESVRRWILHELERGGQVYVVHNRIRDIRAVAQRLSRMVPEARVGVAHGQMAEDELEQVMRTFIEGGIDVLVTTTIVESGIDIPNANTLVIRGAERFGLADLYQLRGRVGRFDRKAYAYLVVSRTGPVTSEARRRLEALMEHTALGSGFQIAMEDLKIRGAGNLLGVEQSGYVSAVGFDLYCRLLREAVARIRATGGHSEGPLPAPLSAASPSGAWGVREALGHHTLSASVVSSRGPAAVT